MKKTLIILLILGLCGFITLEVTTTYDRQSFWLLKTQANGQIEIEWIMVLFLSYQIIFPFLSTLFFSRLNQGIPANNYKITWLKWLNKVNGYITLIIISIIGCAFSFAALTFDPLAGVFSLSVGLLFTALGWIAGKQISKIIIKHQKKSDTWKN